MSKPIKARAMRLSPVGPWEGEIYALPKGRATYDQMVEQMAYAILSEGKVTLERAKDIVPHIHVKYLKEARAALKAIGITRP